MADAVVMGQRTCQKFPGKTKEFGAASSPLYPSQSAWPRQYVDGCLKRCDSGLVESRILVSSIGNEPRDRER